MSDGADMPPSVDDAGVALHLNRIFRTFGAGSRTENLTRSISWAWRKKQRYGTIVTFPISVDCAQRRDQFFLYRYTEGGPWTGTGVCHLNFSCASRRSIDPSSKGAPGSGHRQLTTRYDAEASGGLFRPCRSSVILELAKILRTAANKQRRIFGEANRQWYVTGFDSDRSQKGNEEV